MARNNRYTDRQEAIYREILVPLSMCDDPDRFDTDAIADQVLTDRNDGYHCKVSPGRFWEIAAQHRE